MSADRGIPGISPAILWDDEEWKIIDRYVAKGLMKRTDHVADGVKPVNLTYVGEMGNNFNCPICYEPTYSPRSLPCGHTFCRDCLVETGEFQAPGRTSCPYCRTQVPARLAKNIGNMQASHPYRQLARSHVKCLNDGCDMVLERYLLTSHVVRHCPYTELDCPDSECSRSLLRKHLLKIDGCLHEEKACPRQQCQATFERWQEDEHEDTCAALTGTCSTCSKLFTLDKLDSHTDSCTASKLCSASKHGCKFSGTDDELQEHERDCIVLPLSRVITAQESLLASYSEALSASHVNHVTSMANHLLGLCQQQSTWIRSLETEIADMRTRCDEMDKTVAAADGSLKREVPELHMTMLNNQQTQEQTNAYIDASLVRLNSETVAQWEAIEALRRVSLGPIPPPLTQQPLAGHSTAAASVAATPQANPSPMAQNLMRLLHHDLAIDDQQTPQQPFQQPMPGADPGFAGLRSGGNVLRNHSGPLVEEFSDHMPGATATAAGDAQRAQQSFYGASELVNALLMPATPAQPVSSTLGSMANSRRSSSPTRQSQQHQPNQQSGAPMHGPYMRRRSSAERSTKL